MCISNYNNFRYLFPSESQRRHIQSNAKLGNEIMVSSRQSQAQVVHTFFSPLFFTLMLQITQSPTHLECLMIYTKPAQEPSAAKQIKSRQKTHMKERSRKVTRRAWSWRLDSFVFNYSKWIQLERRREERRGKERRGEPLSKTGWQEGRGHSPARPESCQ